MLVGNLFLSNKGRILKNNYKMASIDDVVEEIFMLYEKYGNNDYLGENISKTNHMIQCAMLAEREGFSTEAILGAFFHDIGHLVGEYKGLPMMITNGTNVGTVDHDKVGKEYLKEKGFPEEVSFMVEGHVQAKRYLVYKYKDYYDNLTWASKSTLVHQGGPMSEEEASDFEQKPNFKACLRLRSWDEGGKNIDIALRPLERYKIMTKAYLESLAKQF